jgi:hypothetical protein
MFWPELKTCSSALIRHLNCTGGFIHGFHKCVALNVDKEVPEIVQKIEAGVCLNKPTRNFQEIISDDFTPDQVASFRSYVDYKRKHLGNLWGETLTKIRENIARSAFEHKLGESEFMEKAVGDLKTELTSTTWDYEDFKQTFLAQYKMPA